MKSLLKDNNAILNPIITCILSLGLITIMYYMLMPLLITIVNVTIDMGAPASTPLLYLKYARWGFFLFVAAALIILLAKVWKKTHDTGIQGMYGGYR